MSRKHYFVCKIETTWRYSNEAGFSRNLSAWGTKRNENRIIIHYFGKEIEIREDCLIAGYKKSPLSLSIRLVALTDTGRYNFPAIRIIIRSLFQRKPHTIGGFCFECYLAVRSGAKLWCQLINTIAMYVNLSGCSQNMSSSIYEPKHGQREVIVAWHHANRTLGLIFETKKRHRVGQFSTSLPLSLRSLFCPFQTYTNDICWISKNHTGGATRVREAKFLLVEGKKSTGAGFTGSVTELEGCILSLAYIHEFKHSIEC